MMPFTATREVLLASQEIQAEISSDQGKAEAQRLITGTMKA